MAYRKSKRKVRRKITFSEFMRIRKKGETPSDSVRVDSLKKAPAKMYRDTGANFKIKIRRK